MTGNGKDASTKVLTNGAEPEEKSPDKESPEDTPETAPTGRSTLDTLAKHFAHCLAKAGEIWTDETGDSTASPDVLYKTAYTLYRDADANDQPAGPDTEEDGDSDTPF